MAAAGIAGVIAGVFTLLIVLLPQLYGSPSTFEERLAVHGNPWYTLRLWLSYLNIFAILLAALGLAAHRFAASPGLSLTALLLLVFYGATELIGRSIMIFTRENRWVAGLDGADEAERAALLDAIRIFDQIWVGAFPLILICFSLSMFLFALSLRGGDRLQQLVRVALFTAAALGLVTLLAPHIVQLRPIARAGYVLIQPLSRLLVGLFLLREARRL
ncbi:MAG: hypothetical protein AAGA23_02365 [Pseudomonadota bacterium]